MSSRKLISFARAILSIAILTLLIAVWFPSGLYAQAADTITPGSYLLIRAASGDSPVIPNALVTPSSIAVERIDVTKDATGRLMVASEEAPELSGEIHQVENFVQFTLTRSQPRQKVLQEITYLCTARAHPDGTFSGAFSALGRTGGAADGLGGGFKREGSFVLYPQRSK